MLVPLPLLLLVAAAAIAMQANVPWAKPHQLLVVVVVLVVVVLVVVVVVVLLLQRAKDTNRLWEPAPTIDPEAEADCPGCAMVFDSPVDHYQYEFRFSRHPRRTVPALTSIHPCSSRLPA